MNGENMALKAEPFAVLRGICCTLICFFGIKYEPLTAYKCLSSPITRDDAISPHTSCCHRNSKVPKVMLMVVLPSGCVLCQVLCCYYRKLHASSALSTDM